MSFASFISSCESALQTVSSVVVSRTPRTARGWTRSVVKMPSLVVLKNKAPRYIAISVSTTSSNFAAALTPDL